MLLVKIEARHFAQQPASQRPGPVVLAGDGSVAFGMPLVLYRTSRRNGLRDGPGKALSAKGERSAQHAPVSPSLSRPLLRRYPPVSDVSQFCRSATKNALAFAMPGSGALPCRAARSLRARECCISPIRRNPTSWRRCALGRPWRSPPAARRCSPRIRRCAI